MKELRLEELSAEQKLGMLISSLIYSGGPAADKEFTLDLIRKHSLGSVWVNAHDQNRDQIIAEVREAADYPIIIISDSETGIDEYTIPQLIAIAAAGSDPELAYSFGKVLGVKGRKIGYDMTCNVVLDMSPHDSFVGGTTRTFGNDKDKVSELAKAMFRGMHDGGILGIAKHYPGEGSGEVDTHMQESACEETEEELLEYRLYPYLKLIEAGLLDAVMPGHIKMTSIDPEHPATLSKPVLDILRRHGFDGVYITDALVMMGIVLKYGMVGCNSQSVIAGNDLILPWTISPKIAYNALLDAYKAGEITDDMINTQAARVLAAQHKAYVVSKNAETAEITEQDKENFRRMNEDCIYRRVAPGVTPTIDKNGKHLFVVLVDQDFDMSSVDDAPIGPPVTWYEPLRIKEKIKELYPNSDVTMLRLYPSAAENSSLFNKQLAYDDVIYITYWQTLAYLGKECLSSRIIGVMNALQTTNRIGAILHFGNPFMMEDVPRVDRLLQGYCSAQCLYHSLKILCGDAEPKGVNPYDVKYKE